MKRRKIYILLVLSLIYFSVYAQQDVSFYISTQGNDKNDGSINAPFRTLEKARNAIRYFRAQNNIPANGIRVILREGVYNDSGFKLEQQDSGYPSAPITYQSYPNEKVVISGGYDLPTADFEEVEDPAIINRLPQGVAKNILVIDLKALGIEEYGLLKQYGAPGYNDVIPAPELFINDQAMILARYPNHEFLHIAKTIEPGSASRWGREGDDPMIFQYKEDRPAQWKTFDDIWLFGFWFSDWGFATNKIAKIDTVENIITTAFPDVYGLRTDDRPIGRRFYYFNVLEELDMPGEWYLDRDHGKLYLYPPAGFKNAVVQLSGTEQTFIEMNDVSHVHFKGLDFQLNRASGLAMQGGYDNIIEACTFTKIGLHGITIDGGQGHHVDQCEIGVIGSSAVTMTGGDRVKLIPGNHVAEQNHIYDFGRIVQTYQPGIRLSGVGLQATHNIIHDAPHSAILFGGNDHQIAYNEIYKVCKISDDAGAIYGGRDWTSFGTEIQFNYLYDILGDKNRTHAIYLDDQMSGIKVHGNVIFDVTRPMLIGGGDYNTITNNLIIGKTKNATADKGAIKLDQRGLNWQDVGPDHTLYKRLRSVPYRDEPWKDKYPELVNIMEEGPKMPVGNIVKNNVVLNHYAIIADDKVLQHGTFADNWHAEKINIDKVTEKIRNGDLKAMDDLYKKIEKELPGFEPIPISKIGLKE